MPQARHNQISLDATLKEPLNNPARARQWRRVGGRVGRQSRDRLRPGNLPTEIREVFLFSYSGMPATLVAHRSPESKHMPQARKRLVSLEVTPFYHVIARCVRRHFLCGKDPLTGKDYSARKQDIQDRLCLLAEVFAVDVCAYAILSNHYHLVLHIDEQSALE